MAWPILGPMLSPVVAMNQGEFTTIDVLTQLLEQNWQLWTIIKHERPVAALVTEIISYPSKRVCRVVLLGGADFNSWKHLITEIEDFALSCGCTALEAITRPGMARKAKSIGFEPYAIVVTKNLRGRLQ